MAWSYSTLKQFENCARQYHEVAVLKNYKYKQNEQALYGDQVHKAAERYVEHGEPLAPQFTFVKPVVDALLARPGIAHVELSLALNSALEPCRWMAKDVWVRGKVDLLVLDEPNKLAWIVDYKTGSDKYADKDQLDLMSALTFAHYPQVDVVKSALAFLVKNNFIKHTRHRQEMDKVWWNYRARVAKIDAAHASGVWNPTSSGLCKKHCDVLSCEFNGRR